MTHEGPSPMVILATRLRFIENLPYHGIMGLKDEYGWLPDDCDERFGAPANDQPQYGAGLAFCLSCNHTWAAVAVTGTLTFECPSCSRHTGHWKFEFFPPPTTSVLVCQCNNQLFYMTPEGHMCANCGIYQRY